MILVPEDPIEAWHLAQAIEAWRPIARANGVPVPAALVLWAEACRLSARKRPETPGLDRLDEAGAESAPMPRLLLPLDDVSTALGVSERSIARLVADGSLPSVKIERRRLVHVDDVHAYIDSLRTAS